MKLEVLLSVMNLNKKDLERMNITSNCLVINQCGIDKYEEYKNFKIHSYNEIGVSKSRNKALDEACGDILLFCDDDVRYNNDYETIVKNAFLTNSDADVICFNLKSLNREMKQNQTNRRIHFYNCLRYGTFRIAVKKQAISNIKFNELFGPGSMYSSGEDGLFLIECLKKGLNLYASTQNIGTVEQIKSNWFNGYTPKYFFDRGALYCAINKNLFIFMCLYYLIRHKVVYSQIGFRKALSIMKDGKKAYIKGLNYDEYYSK